MSVTVLDAHVHFYPQYDEHEFLQSALSNFARLRQMSEIDADGGQTPEPEQDPISGILCLTESHRCRWFDGLAGTVGQWQVGDCGEPYSKRLESPTGERLIVISGRQVITSERLEVLVLGTNRIPDDGEPASRVIDAALADDCLVILPWGFGKWWFQRGRVIAQLIQDYGAKIQLGDNSGRATLLPKPRLLRHGQEQGLKILSGSDPLPLPGEVHNVARLGVALDSTVDAQFPFAWLKAQVARQQPREIGNREGVARFLKNQLLMQIKKQR
ncbi:MAG: hypothetical protein ACR2PZ_10660 [Pseudomonadales bacterium]